MCSFFYFRLFVSTFCLWFSDFLEVFHFFTGFLTIWDNDATSSRFLRRQAVARNGKSCQMIYYTGDCYRPSKQALSWKITPVACDFKMHHFCGSFFHKYTGVILFCGVRETTDLWGKMLSLTGCDHSWVVYPPPFTPLPNKAQEGWHFYWVRRGTPPSGGVTLDRRGGGINGGLRGVWVSIYGCDSYLVTHSSYFCYSAPAPFDIEAGAGFCHSFSVLELERRWFSLQLRRSTSQLLPSLIWKILTM